jgi:hypothetical protein
MPHVASPINAISPLPQLARLTSFECSLTPSSWQCMVCALLARSPPVARGPALVFNVLALSIFGAGSFHYTMEHSGVSGEDREVVFMVRDQRFVVRRSKLQVQPTACCAWHELAR